MLGAERCERGEQQGLRWELHAARAGLEQEVRAEHGSGGRASETQVKWLRRWLDADPAAALADFRRRAGLAPALTADLPYEIEYLRAGLDLLAQPAGISLVTFGRQGLPAGWEAYVGEQDKLLNPTGVGEAIVGCQTVEGLGHDLRTFLTP